MYEEESMVKELIENGTSIQSVESSIQGLEETLGVIKARMKTCSGLVDETILTNQMQLIREQLYILKDKHQHLLNRRVVLMRQIRMENRVASQTGEAISTIDSLVMSLLKIDDVYMESHKSSNPSIMAFVEDLLKKKNNMIESE